MWVLSTGLAISVFLLIWFRQVQTRCLQTAEIFGRARGCERPPRLQTNWPFGLDLILSAFRFAEQGYVLKFFEDLVSRTGNTFEQVLLGISGIDTFEPENIEAVLSSQFQDFGLGVRRPTFFPLLGDGIFTQDGMAWKHSRDLLRPQFTMNRAENLAQIQDAVEKLLAHISKSDLVDLQPLFFRLTLETTTFLLFGESIGALDLTGQRTGPASEEEDFAEAFTIAQDYLAQRGRLGNLYWLINGPRFWRACRTVHKFIDSMIEGRLEAAKATQLGDEESLGKVGKYIFLDALLQETHDIFTVRSQVLNLLLAGRDTTACCLTWAVRLLSRHPAVMSRLRDEIEREVGQDPPNLQSLKRMTYLSYVLKEVLRLYPSVPINSRTALRNTILPKGGGPKGDKPILLRKGMAVGYSPYIMHRRRDLYGPDADEFSPERWQNKLEKKIGWGYIPFNGGPRVCLGQDFAILEASYTLVRLLQVFPHIIPCDSPKSSVKESSSETADTQALAFASRDERQLLTLVLSCADGCWVRIRGRAKSAVVSNVLA